MKPILFIVALSAALTLSGCGTIPGPESASASPTAEPDAAVTPTAEPSPEPTPTPETRPTTDNISCDAMLDPLVDQALRSTQLLPYEKPWTQFGFDPGGAAIECPWGYEGQMESVSYYAWSALAEGEAELFLALTDDNGQMATEDERGTWVTPIGASPQTVPAILVTDEWIAYAPTPELISAIIWTR